MTKKAIMNIIKEANKNKEIKWDVKMNNKSKIIITNNYDATVEYTIDLEAGDGDDIKIIEAWGETIGYMLYGDAFYSDFSNVEEGIEKAVKLIVRHFYYYY